MTCAAGMEKAQIRIAYHEGMGDKGEVKRALGPMQLILDECRGTRDRAKVCCVIAAARRGKTAEATARC
jgi:hypothetical protein